MIKLIESGRVGKNWYRKYSDGWIEQGGYVPTSASSDDKTFTTVKFHIPFENTPVSFRTNTLHKDNSAAAGNQLILVMGTLTNTEFWLVNDGYGNGFTGYYWEACGY